MATIDGNTKRGEIMRREYVDFLSNIPINVSYINIIEYPIHWHDCMEIIYCLKGRIKINIETETHIINEGELEIINFDEAHSITSVDKDNRILIFQIDTSFFNKYYNIENMFFYTESSAKDVQKHAKYEELRSYLSILLCEIAQRGEDYEDVIEDTLVDILYHLINNFHYLIYDEESLKENEEQFERYDRIIKYIYSNYNNKISLQDIARREYLSSHYLSYSMKNTVGYSFNDFLNLTRVEEAIKLLLDTDKTISEISEDLGFSHTRYFNKHFKKHYKCTPMQYRKKYKVDEEKFMQMKKFTAYPIKEALEEVSYYLQDYLRFNYEGKINRIDVVLSSEETLDKPWESLFVLGSVSKLFKEKNKKILKRMKEDINFSYVLLKDVISKENRKFYYWGEIKEVIQSLLDMDLRPAIYIEDYSVAFYSFLDYFEDIYSSYELEKWKFYLDHNMDDESKDKLKKYLIDYGLEVVEEDIKKPSYNKIHDSPFMLPYLIQRNLDNKFTNNNFYIIDEFNSEEIIDNEVFFGCNGLVNIQGIKKPSYYAYYFLSKLGDNVLSKGEGYIITEKDEEIQILLYTIKDNLKEENLDNIYYNFKKDKSTIENKYSINFEGLPCDYKVIKYEINEKKGSAYNNWVSMGKPKQINYDEINLFKTTSNPYIGLSYSRKSPIYNIVAKVEGYGAVLIILQKVQKHF